MRFFLLLGIFWCHSLFAQKSWQAGVAKVDITPSSPIWLTGFAARTNVSQGKLHNLHVKVLALQDPKGNRAVLITSDLLGFPAEVSEAIAKRASKTYELSRDQLLFNASHTHGAPALASSNLFIYGPRARPEQLRAIDRYTRSLEFNVTSAIGRALQNLEPAQLSFGQGKATFGVNRRKMTPDGLKGFTPNPDGPIDNAVPVLRVENKKGKLMAVVFGYAAHPTTITGGPHYYDFSADYVGFAVERLERENPGAMALFVQGCGGDVMVSPRGTVELARKYGDELSVAVSSVLTNSLRAISGNLKTDFVRFPIEFAPAPDRAHFEEQMETGDLYQRWHAQEMLKKLDRHKTLPTTYPFPLQAWQIGSDLTLIALAGEVVADYAVRLKRELGEETLWVAGYSNDLFAYIPSRRVLQEGGYEGGGAMIYYIQPGPFAPSVEETIIGKAHEMISRVKAKSISKN